MIDIDQGDQVSPGELLTNNKTIHVTPSVNPGNESANMEYGRTTSIPMSAQDSTLMIHTFLLLSDVYQPSLLKQCNVPLLEERFVWNTNDSQIIAEDIRSQLLTLKRPVPNITLAKGHKHFLSPSIVDM